MPRCAVALTRKLMLRRDTERRSQLGFNLNTYGMDLSGYVFAED